MASFAYKYGPEFLAITQRVNDLRAEGIEIAKLIQQHAAILPDDFMLAIFEEFGAVISLDVALPSATPTAEPHTTKKLGPARTVKRRANYALADAARVMAKGGVRTNDIAKKLDLDITTVKSILAGKIWNPANREQFAQTRRVARHKTVTGQSN